MLFAENAREVRDDLFDVAKGGNFKPGPFSKLRRTSERETKDLFPRPFQYIEISDGVKCLDKRFDE